MIRYPDTASEVAFLIGGIGTGNFSLGTRGNLQDFEWFNRPGKGNRNPYTFFALWLKEHDGKTDARVLEAPFHKPYTRSHGLPVELCAGLPRFAASRFSAQYPFANGEFLDYLNDETTLTFKVTVNISDLRLFINKLKQFY